MSDQTGKYNIKAVSNMLGIHPGTLRAWERRYNVIEPVRNEAGHRLYTEDQMKVLKWIMAKVEQGFTIGQAVELLDKQDVIDDVDKERVSSNQLDTFKEDLLQSLLSFNENKSNQTLDLAFNVFSIEKVVITILGDILVEVGDLWERNEISIAHEHFVTSFIRTKIGMVFHNLPVNTMLPKVICVCGPNERHEIGLLIFTFFLRRRGYEAIYLGSGIPEKDVFQVVEEVKPKMIVISCTLVDHLSDTIRLVSQLDEHFSELKIGLGGHAVKSLSKTAKTMYRPYLIGENDDEWLEWLKSQLT
ncbi:MerR family transcriptional regulator [Salipaludibacillus daqingensis]|uniref:MerR family transcriptional regulator n=1 Tax=Salipaludibacillus daqingensis TaxID=3041001 RepID=UPI002476A80E|nr:MerR family transcriptional regulator [Salipaludibacillus daqingensis]